MGEFFSWKEKFVKSKRKGETAVDRIRDFFISNGLPFSVKVWDIHRFGGSIYDQIDDINELTVGTWSGYFNSTGYYELFFENEHDATAFKLWW